MNTRVIIASLLESTIDLSVPPAKDHEVATRLQAVRSTASIALLKHRVHEAFYTIMSKAFEKSIV